jgi:hypothetical protein
MEIPFNKPTLVKFSEYKVCLALFGWVEDSSFCQPLNFNIIKMKFFTYLARMMELLELPLSNKTLILHNLLFSNQVLMNAVMIGQGW